MYTEYLVTVYMQFVCDHGIQTDRVALDSFWNPRVYVINTVEPPSAKSDNLRLMKDDRQRAYLVHLRTLNGVFYVRMGLPDFPFDIQVCSSPTTD